MVTTFLLSALGIGILGSFHCIGMCGPLALSLPVQHLQGFRKAMGIFLYNFGRVVTYSILGIIFGWIGMQFSVFGLQQILSISLGALLIISFIATLFHKRLFKKSTWIQKNWNKYIIQRLAKLFHKKSTSTLFLIGILNGLLPCGLVYIAIAGALATGNILYGGLFMGAFGLGTLPAMMAVTYAGNLISINWRNKMRKSVPYVVGIMGMLLVLRGLNLNIPYLSPVVKENKVQCCH